MPTYRNTGKRPVPFFLKLYQNNGEYRNAIVTLEPGEERELTFALPGYAAKGIELVDAAYPPLPDPVLVDNTSDYAAGVSRTFQIRPCDRYFAQIFIHGGAVSVRFGASGTPFTVDADLAQTFMKKADWEHAPEVILTGAAGRGAEAVTLHIEELSAGEMGGGYPHAPIY